MKRFVSINVLVLSISLLIGCINNISETTESPLPSIDSSKAPLQIVKETPTSSPNITMKPETSQTTMPIQTPSPSPEPTASPHPLLKKPLNPNEAVRLLFIATCLSSIGDYHYDGLYFDTGFYLIGWSNPGGGTGASYLVNPYNGDVYNEMFMDYGILLNLLDYSVNLEIPFIEQVIIYESDFTLTDGATTIELGVSLENFLEQYPFEEINSDAVGNIITGESIYINYCYKYENLEVFASNTNWNFMGKSSEDLYVTQLNLLTNKFQTSRNITIGSSFDEVIASYGMLYESVQGETLRIRYTWYDRALDFYINDENEVEKILILIIPQENSLLIELALFENAMLEIIESPQENKSHYAFQIGETEYNRNYKDTFQADIYYKMNAVRFAVLDMDSDGSPEIVIDSGDTIIQYLYFDYYDGSVYSYDYTARQAGGLKADGTVFFSGGAAISGFGSLEFSDGKCEVICRGTSDFYFNDAGESISLYYLNGILASKEDFDKAYTIQDKKASADWYEFNDNNVIYILRTYLSN